MPNRTETMFLAALAVVFTMFILSWLDQPEPGADGYPYEVSP